MDKAILTLTVATGLWCVCGFNLETERPVVFTHEEQTQFGVRLAQFNANRQKWTLVTAPLQKNSQQNKTGAIYKCLYNDRHCTQLNTPVPVGSENLGLSLTTSNMDRAKFLACVPRYSYHCHTNTYINGYCQMFDSSGSNVQRIPSQLPVCPKVLIDIAFLIDGSGSVHGTDFNQMKTFIKAIMGRFRSKETQMALAQFSWSTRTEFTFSDYNWARNKEQLVDQIRQMRSGTQTPAGIKYIANRVFTSSAGARDGAKRVLITITDGLSQDNYFDDAIRAANRKKIERYAIGVGGAFSNNQALKELQTIASRDKNVFRVDNFGALDSIQKELQEKIFAIEGSASPGTSASFQLEMAQEGFSSLITDRSVVLGAVGAYDWSGALVKFRDSSRTLINMTAPSAETRNAYLGYTVKEARKGSLTLFVAGAPRSQHKGQVVIFSENGELRDRIVGSQIGSYFGSELCPVDLNGDGQTDLLLVGAPMYHKQLHGGIVNMYTMDNRGMVKQVGRLQGQSGQILGRFGSAIAQLTDLNGDGFRDVAIGAPLENGHRGTVYIYHGTRDRIRQTASQTIEASTFDNGLRYFGQAIDGAMDISGDGLTDIAVGAQGKVFILRSRPVMEVRVSMKFTPSKILLKDVDCPENKEGPRVNVEICFSSRQLTRQVEGRPSLNISYELKLDEHRKIERAELTSRSHGVFVLTKSECLAPTIQVKSCIQDFLNPIELNVLYTGEGLAPPNEPAPILQSGNRGTFLGNLPFEKECGEDNICKDHLKVKLEIVGAQFIIVGSYSTLTLEVTLENTDENSYFAVLTYRVPTGLTFRKTSVISAKRRSHVECDDSNNGKYAAVGIIACKVNHPIFRSNATVRFNTTFDVASDVEWGSTELISVNATSDNDQRTVKDSFVSRRIGVKYEVNVIIKGIESTQYVNFTIGKAQEKIIQHMYRVENIGQQSLPVNITFVIPMGIAPGLSWDRVTVNTNGNEQMHGYYHQSEWKGDTNNVVPSNNSQICTVLACQIFLFQLQQLRYRSSTVFSVTGAMRWSDLTQAHAQEIMQASYAAVSYDEDKYIHVSQATNQFQQATVTTRVEIIKEFNSLPVIIGSSIGGLILLALAALILYKVGFFKRSYKDKLEEDAGDDGPAGEPTTQQSAPA